MGQNIEREAKDNIRREVTAYAGADVQFYRTDRGDAVRAVIQYRGKSREVRFWRVTNQGQAMKSIIFDTRRQMRDLGIIDREKGRQPVRHVGIIGEKLLDAVKKAAPEAFAPPPTAVQLHPMPEPEIDVGTEDDEPDDPTYMDFDRNFLCPDEIAERTQRNQEKPPMTEPAAPEAPQAKANGTNGHTAAPTGVVKNKLAKLEVVALTKLLMRHGATDEATGIYAYNEGWSDERLHAELKTKAAPHVVSETRRDGFGKLASEVKAKSRTDADRIGELEARVAKLEADLRTLIG